MKQCVPLVLLAAACVHPAHPFVLRPTPQQASTTTRRAAALSASSELPADQVIAFLRQGHTVTRGLLASDELAGHWTPRVLAAFEVERLEALRHEVQVFFGQDVYRQCTTVEQCLAQLAKKDDDAITPFLQVFNLWRRHPQLQPLVLSKTLGHVAAQLLGVPRVRLFQDSLFCKRPGDDPTLFHTDLGTSPLDTNSFVTAWIPLTPIPSIEKGGSPLQFCDGSHVDVAHKQWYDPHEDDDTTMLQRYTLRDYAPLALGDVTWHHGWTLHGSPGNTLGEARVALTVCFTSAQAKVMGKDVLFFPDEEDAISYEDWIAEVGVGGVVDHPLLPIVYP